MIFTMAQISEQLPSLLQNQMNFLPRYAMRHQLPQFGYPFLIVVLFCFFPKRRALTALATMTGSLCK